MRIQYKELFGIMSWVDYIRYSRLSWILNDIEFYIWNQHLSSKQHRIEDKLKNWLP